MSIGKKNIVLIASDHTRPVPSKIIIPAMLKEIRSTNPDAQITILVATGCHRESSKEELIYKFGEDIVNNEHIIVHDCDDLSNMVSLGKLPSGGELILNKLVLEADLLCSEGFIEPHFFAGFSGGRKSVLPGVASRKTVLANHCSKFVDSIYARTGIIENNPIHEDMVYAARKANLAFIVNVIINQKKEIVYAVAGDLDLAHQNGVRFLNKYCRVSPVQTEIVLTTNGGYPLDQNIYQAVKGMTAAEAAVTQNGVIIIAAKSSDGHGGQVFYETFRDEPSEEKIIRKFIETPASETIPDQWQSQIFARILKKAKVIYISDVQDQIIHDLHMIPAHSVAEAVELADKLLEKTLGIARKTKITVITDGVSVIVSK